MDKRKLSNMLLILTALIWGSAFVAQSIGMEYIGPFTFGAVRSILGGLTLLPVIFFRKKKSQANKGKAEPDEKKEKNEQRKTLLAGGICCGICLTIGSMAQQIGLQYTTAGKGGFITALYILIVPLLGLAFGRKAGKKVWCGVILAVEKKVTLIVSHEWLHADDHVLIIDDFMAKGYAMQGLIDLVNAAGATLEGIGVAVEKGFQGGGDKFRASGVPYKALAVIEQADENGILFREDD